MAGLISRLLDPSRIILSVQSSKRTTALNELARTMTAHPDMVNFDGISKEAKALLVDVRRQVNKIEARELIAEWTKAAQAVQRLADSPELKTTIAGFGKASNDLSAVLGKLEARIDPTGQKLDEALAQTKTAVESFNATALALRRFINDNQQLGNEAGQSLQRIGEAADAIQRLADFIERNPASLVTGRKKPD